MGCQPKTGHSPPSPPGRSCPGTLVSASPTASTPTLTWPSQGAVSRTRLLCPRFLGSWVPELGLAQGPHLGWPLEAGGQPATSRELCGPLKLSFLLCGMGTRIAPASPSCGGKHCVPIYDLKTTSGQPIYLHPPYPPMAPVTQLPCRHAPPLA